MSLKHWCNMVIHRARRPGVTAEDQAAGDNTAIAAAELTLTEALVAIEAVHHRPVAGTYPTGRKAVLHGRSGDLGLPGVPGFADRPLGEFTLLAVEANMAALRTLVGQQELARHTFADTDPRSHGWAAAKQYGEAARRMTKMLVREGFLSHDPLTALVLPRPVEPSREGPLSHAELADYCGIMLAASDDPVLDALLWITLRCSAARATEVRMLNVLGANAATGMVTVLAKGTHHRYLPVPCPVVQACLVLAEQRPTRDPAAPLFRARNGHRISRNRFNVWSKHLHQKAEWAKGERIQVHCLRHSTARLVYEETQNSLDVTIYLAQSLNHGQGPSAPYLRMSEDRQAVRRREIARRCFGPKNRWPTRLPEWPSLAPYLPTEWITERSMKR